MRNFLFAAAAVTWAACEPQSSDDLESRTDRVLEARRDVSKAEEDMRRAEQQLSEAEARLETRERELQMQVEALGEPPAEPGVQPARTE